MNNKEFSKKWKTWMQSYKQIENRYNRNIWIDYENHPQDLSFEQLASLYSDATVRQRRKIKGQFSRKQIRLRDLVMYIRRLGIIISMTKMEEYVDTALTLSGIAIRYGFSDLTVSLILMKIGAEKAGISTSEYFENHINNASGDYKTLLNNVYTHPKDLEIRYITKYGPPEWQE